MVSDSCTAGTEILDPIGISLMGHFRHQVMNLVLQVDIDLGETAPKGQDMIVSNTTARTTGSKARLELNL